MSRWSYDDDVYLQARISELAGSLAETERGIASIEIILDEMQRGLGHIRNDIEEAITANADLQLEIESRLRPLEKAFSFLLPSAASEQI